ncbi:hypothetical protein DPMN_123640 [Dreissena polymorpha]|uniref:Uncharacterized protein n=2 Tax=Dreissena polymorpha TaxID=45954 RepID=A0A9D4JVJ1_DREPO|nr:hypothetical protein DPMN_123640 [Dreissena polymorpha]
MKSHVMCAITSNVACQKLKFDALQRVTLPKELRRKDVEVIEAKDSAVLCLKDDCRDLPYENIRCKLEDHVYTVEEYTQLTRLPYVNNASDIKVRKTRAAINPCAMGIATDLDYCCPTTRYFSIISQGVQLVSNNNETCLVISLPGKFQCITMAACCGGGTCISRRRKCMLEKSQQSIYVWNSNTGEIGFKMFPFPAYCSCK